jgi:hypothetical protein
MSSSKKIGQYRDFAAGVYQSFKTRETVSHVSIFDPAFGYGGGYCSESRGAGGYRNDNRYGDNRSGGGGNGSRYYGGGGNRSGPESGNDRYYRGGDGRGGGGRGGRGWKAGKVFNPY